MLNLKVSKRTRSEVSKNKVIIKRVSNISINQVNLSKGEGGGPYKLRGGWGCQKKIKKLISVPPFIKHLGGVNKSLQTMLDGTFLFRKFNREDNQTCINLLRGDY